MSALEQAIKDTSALEQALKDIERSFGKGSIFELGSHDIVACEVIPTGAPTLDVALGIGGLARGRIAEVYGPESSGKTTLVLHVMANAQAQGLKAAFIDAEHALDPTYAKALGVDVDRLLVSQPDCGEQALEICDRLVKSGEVGVVAIDSVAALTPRAELDGEMGQQTVGLQARMMSQAMRKLAGGAHRSNTLVVFTNQIREKVGIIYGSPETQPGGRALKFFASQRIDVRRKTTNRDGGDAVSNTVKFKVVKNKLAPPFREAEADLIFGEGFDLWGPTLDQLVADGRVDKSGAWYRFEDGTRLQGRDSAREHLKLTAAEGKPHSGGAPRRELAADTGGTK
jgi:recombination protein RecA